VEKVLKGVKERMEVRKEVEGGRGKVEGR